MIKPTFEVDVLPIPLTSLEVPVIASQQMERGNEPQPCYSLKHNMTTIHAYGRRLKPNIHKITKVLFSE